MSPPLIILGASARAAAGSALRAGYTPWCIDRFGDRDLRRMAEVHPCPPGEYPTGMLRLLEQAPRETPVLLTGAMENHPQLLDAITLTRPMLGSGPEAIRRVRDPLALPSLPATKGLRFCDTRVRDSRLRRLSRLALGPLNRGRYLVKPRRSAGGVGLEWGTPTTRLDADHYLQQHIRGTPCAAVFRCDGWSARLLGVTEQLIGEAGFGAEGFRYCGSMGPITLSNQARQALSHLGVQLAQRYDMRGLFGVDVVRDRRGRVWPVEVNPRYVASVEILEQAGSTAMLNPAARPEPHPPPAPAWRGKAIVHAPHRTRVGDLERVLPAPALADIPEPGRTIQARRPICTVFAEADDRQACHRRLHELAAKVYASGG